MMNKPLVAKYKYTVDSSTGVNSKLIATSEGHELVAILVTAGSADIAVGIYDTSIASPDDKINAIFLGANQGESNSFCPVQPIPMNKGIYINIEQGGGSFNGKATVLFN